jgi:predicted permease
MRLLEWVGVLGRRLSMLFSRRERFDRELEEEMRLHRELRARELHEEGAEREDAHYAAQRRFGNSLRLREEIHQAWGWTWLDRLVLDLRYAARRLRQSPGFTTVAVLTLALGIGANTAIFTLIQQVMLSPLPVARPQELYSLGDDKNGCCWGGLKQGDFSVYSYPLYTYLRDHTPEFSELAGFLAGSVSVGVRRSRDTNPARMFRAEWVSGNYFQMFEVQAYAGRMLTPADDQDNAPAVAVISYETWQSQFGSQRQLVGETVVIDGLPMSVVGIAPPGFFGDTRVVNPADFWLPLATEPVIHPQAAWLNAWNEYWLYAMGRLRPGADPTQVQAHVTTELQQWLTTNYVADHYNSDASIAARYTKDISDQHIVVMPAAGGVASTRYSNQESLQLLMVISGLVLLIACGNISNLLLARGATQRTQTAVRVALGASRARILRQTMTEGLLLAVVGGAAGVWMSMVTARGILLLAFRDAAYVPIHTTPTLPVLGFALAISMLTGVIFSIAPAWIASRTQPFEPMRGAPGARDRSALPQKSLVVLQAALSLVLLVGAGLLTATLRRLEAQPFGIEAQGSLLARIDLPRTHYRASRLEAFYRDLQQQLERMPRVLSAGLSSSAPMAGGTITEPVSIQGKPPVPLLQDGLWPSEVRISAHYFETVGTRVLRGRAIDEHDTPGSPHVAVIDQAFARFYFPDEDPIGKHFGIQTQKHSHDYEIVGIVQNAQYRNVRSQPYPTFFLPLLQEERYEDTAEDKEQFDSKYIHNVQLRVRGRPEDFRDPLRRALGAVDPNLTVQNIRTFDDQVSRNFDQERLIVRLTIVYGLLALALASVGLYGVASYAVARRTNEIGVRMAVGADRGSVIALMLRGSMRPIALGLAIGVPVALGGARVIASHLYGVKSYDPWIFGFATLLLALCAMAAAYVPARRAASIDPMQALRAE